MVPRHVATCSGPARAAERALPCGGRVRVVHASLHGSSILRSCSLVVTLIITKEVRVLPPLFLQHGSCQLICCAVSVGFWCALLVLEPCSSTSSCALSVLGLVTRTVVGGPTAEPRRSNARRLVVRLARCVCALVLCWVLWCSSAVPSVWLRCLVRATYPIWSRSHPNPVVRGP